MTKISSYANLGTKYPKSWTMLHSLSHTLVSAIVVTAVRLAHVERVGLLHSSKYRLELNMALPLSILYEVLWQT